MFSKIFLLHKVVRDAKKVEKHWFDKHRGVKTRVCHGRDEGAAQSACLQVRRALHECKCTGMQ